MKRNAGVLASCGVLWTSGAFGQCGPVWTQDGPKPEAAYGWGAANLGDLNGDGLSDLIVQFDSSSDGASGYVVTTAIVGDATTSCDFCSDGGFRAYPLGDIDGDGIAEWLKIEGTGARLISGVNQEQWNYFGNVGFLGGARCGDINGDGVTDFAVGDPDVGATTIYSGATREVLGSVAGACNDGMPIDDLSGDGIGDLILWIGNTGNSETRVYSGADLSMLYSFQGSGYLGSTMAPVGDVDGDGAADFVSCAGLYRVGSDQVGRVVLVSGASGASLGELVGTTGEPLQSVYAAGDWNLDGVADVAVSSPNSSVNGYRSGRVWFRSGDDLHIIDRIDGAASDWLSATPATVDLPGQNRPAILLARRQYNGFRGRIELALSRCRADLNCDGTTNTIDVIAFLNLFGAGDTRADVNFDDVVDTQDVLAYLNMWVAGC